MENTKNTVLLTIIAVATLLVAVVGATFAYFQAQGGSSKTAAVNVATGTAGNLSFGTFGAINIYADQSNFASGQGDKTGSSTGTVSWTAPGATASTTPAAADRTICYTAALAITTNTFTKSTANTSNLNELEFSAVKDSTTLIDRQSLVTLSSGAAVTGTINIPTAKGGTTYKHTLTADAGKTVSNAWTFTVTLKNLTVDQQQNTGKSFAGTIKFTKVDC